MELKVFLKFFLQPIKTAKKLEKFTFEKEEYYIESGVFIMSQSKSLFNQIFPTDGYLLDTTWWVLSHYVTCILTVCFYNTSIPIAFAFGNGETIGLYDKLLKTVSK